MATRPPCQPALAGWYGDHRAGTEGPAPPAERGDQLRRLPAFPPGAHDQELRIDRSPHQHLGDRPLRHPGHRPYAGRGRRRLPDAVPRGPPGTIAGRAVELVVSAWVVTTGLVGVTHDEREPASPGGQRRPAHRTMGRGSLAHSDDNRARGHSTRSDHQHLPQAPASGPETQPQPFRATQTAGRAQSPDQVGTSPPPVRCRFAGAGPSPLRAVVGETATWRHRAGETVPGVGCVRYVIEIRCHGSRCRGSRRHGSGGRGPRRHG